VGADEIVSAAADAVYFAGYDANKAPLHDTAWIYRSTTAAAIMGALPR
jgi:hypothetical protein